MLEHLAAARQQDLLRAADRRRRRATARAAARTGSRDSRGPLTILGGILGRSGQASAPAPTYDPNCCPA